MLKVFHRWPRILLLAVSFLIGLSGTSGIATAASNTDPSYWIKSTSPCGTYGWEFRLTTHYLDHGVLNADGTITYFYVQKYAFITYSYSPVLISDPNGPVTTYTNTYQSNGHFLSATPEVPDFKRSGKLTIPCQCTLKVEKITAGGTINPYAGQDVPISGSITADPPDTPFTWKLTLPNGSISKGNGAVTASWDGRLADGKLADNGGYPVTLSAKSVDGKCSDSKTATIKVIRNPNDCKLQITVGSTANAASGNLSHSQVLFSSKGKNLPLSMTLYYNSMDGYTGPLGLSWDHNYNIRLVKDIDGSMILHEGNGTQKYYEFNGTGYIPQPGDYSTLAENADRTYVLTHRDGSKYNFGADGHIASITDRNNNAITFGYANGDLATITDPASRTVTLAYDGSHHITSITDPNGNTHSFSYSGNMLTSVESRTSTLTAQTWRYTYDADGFMLTKTDPAGFTTGYGYDADHRVVKSVDPSGQTRSIAYPASGTAQIKETVVTERDGGLWRYSYDTQFGLLMQKIDPNGGVTSYTYDANRNMLSKTEPGGTATSYTYDGLGNMLSVTDVQGNRTSYSYNYFGQVTSVTDPLGNTTSYSYDNNGNLLSLTDPAGGATRYQYDAMGNITQITNAAGQVTKMVYDAVGNLLSVTDPAGGTSAFTYDVAGNLVSQTDVNGAIARFEYNSLNQLIKVTDPNGNATSYTYDAKGNRSSQTDANGNTTSYEYDYQGKLVKVTDALGNVTRYTYGGGTGCPSCGGGGGDKLTAITDANGNSTHYDYDQLGRLIKETDPLGNSISYTYDAKGNLTSKTDANGNTISYRYDALGRLTKKVYPDLTEASFSYDAKKNVITAANQHISYTLRYDVAGRITGITDNNGKTVSYQYDTLGNRTRLITPENKVIDYTYNLANRLAQMNTWLGNFSFAYDVTGKRTKLTRPNGTVTTYAYDGGGRLTELTHKSSFGAVIDSFSYTLDKVGNRLTKGTPNALYNYNYDAIYRLLKAIPAKVQGRWKEEGEKGDDARQEAYTYDPVGNRLTGPEADLGHTFNVGNQLVSDSKHQYQYDKNGNLINKAETDDDGKRTTWTYAYDYENRLIKVVKQEGLESKTVSFKYDPFGRRIEKNITEVEDGYNKTKTHAYVYDNENIILAYLTKSDDGRLKTEVTRYVHGLGVDEHLAVEKKDKPYFYHADGLGSIVALTDYKQKAVVSYDYDSFGNMDCKGDSIKQPYTYTGREWDEEIELYYYRARYYDARSGRFISADPILHPANGPPTKSCNQSISYPTFAALIATPQKLNPYAYVDNSPINLTDPTGLIAVPCELVAGGKFALCLGGTVTGAIACASTCGKLRIPQLIEPCLAACAASKPPWFSACVIIFIINIQNCSCQQ